MKNNLDNPSRWTIIGAFIGDIVQYSFCIAIIGFFIYITNKLHIFEGDISISPAYAFQSIMSKVILFLGVILALFFLHSLILMIVDILTLNCTLERVKVLKVKRYCKISSGHMHRHGLFMVALFENGQVMKLKANDVDISQVAYCDVVICNNSKYIVDFIPCNCTNYIHNSYSENYSTKHSGIYNFLEEFGCVSECYSKEKIIFNFLFGAEVLAIGVTYLVTFLL